jgi:hypothetical protein
VNAPEVVSVYHGVDDPTPDALVTRLLDRLGRDRCRPVPLHGFGVVTCG